MSASVTGLRRLLMISRSPEASEEEERSEHAAEHDRDRAAILRHPRPQGAENSEARCGTAAYRPISASNGMGKTTSTSLGATALLRGLRLAAAIRLTHATGIARFLIRTGKSAILNPNALGDMELTDSIHLGGCASGLGAL